LLNTLKNKRTILPYHMKKLILIVLKKVRMVRN